MKYILCILATYVNKINLARLFFVFLFLFFFSGYGHSQGLSEMDTTQLKKLLSETKNSVDKIPVLKELFNKNASVNKTNLELYLGMLVEIAEKENLQHVLGYVFDRRATLAYFSGDFDQARSYFLESFTHNFEADSLDKAYIAKTKVGVMHSIQSDYTSAEKIYREVEKEISKVSHPRATAFLHNNLGTLFHYMGVVDSAHHYYSKAIQDYFDVRDSINVLRPMQNQSILWQGDEKKTIARLIEIADIRRALGHKADLLNTLNALSSTEMLNDINVERAQKYAIEGYLLSKEVGNVDFAIANLNRLTRISTFQEDFEQAIEYSQEAKNLAFNLDTKMNLFNVYMSRANIYFEQKDYLKAESEYKNAEKLLIDIEKSEREIDLYSELANLYFLMENRASADEYLEKALQFESEGDFITLMDIYVLKAKISHKDKDWKDVLKYKDKAIGLGNKNRLDAEVELLQLSSLAYRGLGRNNDAYIALSQYVSLRDTLDNRNNFKAMIRQQKDFEFAQEKEILALEQEKKEAILKAESAQVKTAAFGIGSVALLALGFFWNSRRKNKIIAKANDQLSALNNTKDQIFSIIGHDLKKPAIAFRGITEKLRYLINSEDKDRLLKYGESIEKDALELNNLTDNLLSWALLQKDLVTFKEEKINLANVSQEVVNLFSNVAKEKNITLTSEIQNVFVKSDKNALATVLRNLVDNALKYTDANGEVVISTVEKSGKVELLIKDNGKGIEGDRLPNLFALTKEKSTQGTSGENGTGLGLHIVKDLVEKSKGSINVESVFGEGTTFRVALPSG